MKWPLYCCGGYILLYFIIFDYIIFDYIILYFDLAKPKKPCATHAALRHQTPMLAKEAKLLRWPKKPNIINEAKLLCTSHREADRRSGPPKRTASSHTATLCYAGEAVWLRHPLRGAKRRTAGFAVEVRNIKHLVNGKF